jgi:dipeptidyl aminopeptidase/acylaminoacyl peptidase
MSNNGNKGVEMRFFIVTFLLSFTFFINSCSNSSNTSKTPLIERSVFFGNPDKASLKLSDDGKYISFLAPENGVLNVWIAPADNPKSATAITHDTLRGIRRYFWAYTNKHILYLQDEGGDENWLLHAVNIESKEDRNLTPFDEIIGADGKPIMLPSGKKMRPRVNIDNVSHNFPNEILIGLNKRDPRYHDIFRLNILTGKLKLIQKNEGFLGFSTDDNYKVRLADKMTPDGGNEYFKPDGKGGWKTYFKIPREDMMTTNVLGFDKSGTKVYMTDSRNRNTASLTILDLKTDKSELIAEDPKADISNIIIHPSKQTIQAASVNYLRTKWEILDNDIAKDIKYLNTLVDGDLIITSRTYDDKFWTIAFNVDNGPVPYYLYDRANKKAKFMFYNRKALEGLKLAKMYPLEIKSRDGLNLISYLTLPPWTDKNLSGHPDKALPMVLFVHGGPWSRDTWGYNPYHQWLANRGYAVLSVNYRGSTGFGKKFLNAAIHEWAGKMHNDLIDAVNYSIKNGIASKDKIAIMGGSYGGYAALVGLTFTPDVFACGVDIVGPSNLKTLLGSIPPYWAAFFKVFATHLGDPATEEGNKLLEERSPINFVNKIKKPLLIGQGANDPRVKQAEADQIAKAMQDKNLPVTYVLYPDEGHGFARPANKLSFNAVVDLFLGKYLGGRVQPLGEDLKGSTIQVVKGKDLIPGLTEALQP